MRRLSAFHVPVHDLYWSYPLNLHFESFLKWLQVKYPQEQWWMAKCTRKWLMRIVETIWGNARDVLAAPDEDQHAYGILRKCCRRRCSAMAALLYAATCCRSVQSQSHLWFSESDAGDMATALTWKPLDRFPLPSPATRPALSLDPSPAALWITLQLPIYFFFLLHLPLLGHKPALLDSSSLEVVFTEYARPRLRLIFLSRSPLFSLYSPTPTCCRLRRFSTTGPCLLLTKLLFLVTLGW